MPTALIIGASGKIGSRLVRELDSNHDGINVRLTSSRSEMAERWRAEGRDAVVLDLNRPETFAHALAGVDRVFLLTGYTADMLYQSKTLVDAAAKAGVRHLVHLGVFSSRRDLVPHYAWHDLIETYIEASGVAWTHLHPNNIIESTLDTDPPVTKTRAFTVNLGEAPQGWIAARDIAAVAAAVLREGPTKHAGANYWLSTEVLTGPQVAEVLTRTLGIEITCTVHGPGDLAALVQTVPVAAARLYFESAVQKMRQAESGNLPFEVQVRDDVMTVLGRPGTTIAQWAEANLKARS